MVVWLCDERLLAVRETSLSFLLLLLLYRLSPLLLLLFFLFLACSERLARVEYCEHSPGRDEMGDVRV